MAKKTRQEAERIIRGNDSRKFDSRVKRLINLGVIEFSAVDKQPPHYLWAYLKETADSYEEGCFRGCIFYCASIVEQIIKHEIIRNSGDPEEKQWEIEIRRRSFGDLIKNAEKLPLLKPFLNDASWLRDARNLIAAHPLYVGVYEKDDTPDIKIWKNKTMIRNIRKTLNLLNDRDRKQMLGFKLILQDKKEVKLNDALKDPTSEYSSIMWGFFPEDAVLEVLASEAHQRMKKITEGVYPVR